MTGALSSILQLLLPCSIESNSTNALQQLGQLGLLALQVAVATNVLLADEDVRDGTLAADLLERILDLVAVGLIVQLDGVELGV